jgi:alpha-L-fucosidase
MGNWLNTYGESIYNTKAGFLKPQDWGCMTEKKGKVFVHILNDKAGIIKLEKFPYKHLKKAYLLKDKSSANVSFKGDVVEITPSVRNQEEPDQVIVLEVSN